MDGRIGALHLHYRAAGRGSIAAALVPGLDRAISARLGDALDERLSAMLGADSSVVVIRELTAHVAIGKADWALDSRVVDKVSRASADAVATLLAAPPSSDAMVRFADQAEFVASFIVDLVSGSAWERWYYGAFRPYRQIDVRATIEAVLADNRPHAARVFGWLARRGHLADVLALLGPAEARRLATAAPDDAPQPPIGQEAGPLAAAAFDLLAAYGWPAGDATARAILVSQYLATAPIPPAWTDRRALTVWLLEFARFVVSTLARGGTRRQTKDVEAAARLLAGRLDWLDTAWLAPQLDELLDRSPVSHQPTARTGRRILASQHERMLERAAELVRDRRVCVDRTTDRDTLIVRLIAAMSADDEDRGPPDRALIAVVERVVDAWRAAVARGLDAEARIAAMEASTSSPGSAVSTAPELTRRIDAVRAAGPAAVELLRQLANSAVAAGESGDPTPGASLYLLTRGVLDVKLSALARDAGVPFEALLGALALQWLGLEPPFDGPTALWVGAAQPDLNALDAPGARLADLQQALLDLLIDQRAVDALPADDAFDGSPMEGGECSAASRLTLARIAWLVMRAWSRWLPGVGGASMPFLVRNCLQRLGRVRVSDGSIEVQLDPAPLDVVLEMAGYFRPIEHVAWLDHRTVTFTRDRIRA